MASCLQNITIAKEYISIKHVPGVTNIISKITSIPKSAVKTRVPSTENVLLTRSKVGDGKLVRGWRLYNSGCDLT